MNDRPSPSRHAVAWLTFLGLSLVLHTVLTFTLYPVSSRTLAFDRQDEEQRSAELAERQRLLEKVRQQQRRERAVPREQAERLKKEREERARRPLKEQVERIQLTRAELEQMKQEALAELQKRTDDDIARVRASRLLEMAVALRRRNTRYWERPGTMPSDARPVTEEMTDRVVQKVHAIVEGVDDYVAVTTETIEILDEMNRVLSAVDKEPDRPKEPVGHSAGRVAQAARDLARELRARLGKEIDAPPMNQMPATELATTIPEPEPDAATNDPTPPAAEPSSDLARLYDKARTDEQAADEAFRVIRAVEMARMTGSSLADALNNVSAFTPDRPDLVPVIDQNPGRTADDLAAHRQAVERAEREAQAIASRTQGMSKNAERLAAKRTGDGDQTARDVQARLAARTMPDGVVDMTGLQTGTFESGSGGGDDETGLRIADYADYIAGMEQDKKPDDVDLDFGRVAALALPARKIVGSSDRIGWLYLDTWYVIGPWSNRGRIDYERSHPPEQAIDLDAEYTDGKFAGQLDHPDRVLRWSFYQSNEIRNQPPRVYASATYYAYTELYSDRDRDMLVAIACDDAAKVWLNDQVIWEDATLSQWRLGQTLRKVRLNQGYNRLLMRIENGPAYTIWSVVLCPPEAVGR
ncbi:MAG: hypothetical protein ACFCVE_04910 [Phycisphaerae bacterium]